MSNMELYMRKEVVRASEYVEGMEDTWTPMFAQNVFPEWVYKVADKDGVVLVATLVDSTGAKVFIKKDDMIVEEDEFKYTIPKVDFHKKYKKIGR